jgi:hypothetical protein
MVAPVVGLISVTTTSVSFAETASRFAQNRRPVESKAVAVSPSSLAPERRGKSVVGEERCCRHLWTP